MKRILSILCLLLSFCEVHSQLAEKFTVKAGEDLESVLSSHGMYRFPAFRNGRVALRDGTIAGGRMNFNIFLGEIQFIDPKGDTLVIAEPETVDSVSIDSNLFFYRKGYFQEIAHSGAAKLLMKQKIEFRPIKIGAYGSQSPGASIENYGRITTIPYVNNNHLSLNEDIIVYRETNYSLLYKKFREAPASRSGFLSLFPDRRKNIDDFIAANKIDFNKVADLEKLLSFCAREE